MIREEEAWEAPFVDAFDEDTQSFPFGTNSLYANPDCKARMYYLPILILTLYTLSLIILLLSLIRIYRNIHEFSGLLTSFSNILGVRSHESLPPSPF